MWSNIGLQSTHVITDVELCLRWNGKPFPKACRRYCFQSRSCLHCKVFVFVSTATARVYNGHGHALASTHKPHHELHHGQLHQHQLNQMFASASFGLVWKPWAIVIYFSQFTFSSDCLYTTSAINNAITVKTVLRAYSFEKIHTHAYTHT